MACFITELFLQKTASPNIQGVRAQGIMGISCVHHGSIDRVCVEQGDCLCKSQLSCFDTLIFKYCHQCGKAGQGKIKAP